MVVDTCDSEAARKVPVVLFQRFLMMNDSAVGRFLVHDWRHAAVTPKPA
jgi:hypothetical protein